MSHRAANLSLVEPLIAAARLRTEAHYPPQLVLWGALAFCLSVWGVVIVAVARYA